MNNARRRSIRQVISRLHIVQNEMDSILEEIEILKDEESECFERIPENLQGSERYEISESAVANLESAYDYFNEACSPLGDVISSLEEALN